MENGTILRLIPLEVKEKPQINLRLGLTGLQWLLSIIDRGEAIKTLKELTDNRYGFKTWNKFIWNLFQDFNAVRLKMAAYECMLNSDSSLSDIEGTMSGRGITAKTDILLYHTLANTPIIMNSWKLIISSAMKEKGAVEDFITDPFIMERQLNEDLKTYRIQSRAGFLAYKKLTFIAHGNNMDIADFTNDLLERAIGYYYYNRPLCSRLHAVNYMKSAINGRVCQLIQYWTNEQRSTIVTGESIGQESMFANRKVGLTPILESTLTNDDVWGI